jgi:MFS family permease
MARDGVDSRYAWLRLGLSMTLSTIGGVGMWSVVVVLPAVQMEFGIDRGAASLPFTLVYVGFAAGGVMMGRLADRFGIAVPMAIAACCLGLGYAAAALSANIGQFALAHGVLIGALGTGACFGPLMADVSHWFQRYRGIAVALAASGNYLAGVLWPPAVQAVTDAYGWRVAHFAIGAFCVVTMLPLAFALRRRPPVHTASAAAQAAAWPTRPLGMAPNALQGLLVVAGVACCVAMAMPQVHLVAYCGDLGYGPARGTGMLSMMLAFGIVSRIGSGFIADRVGGVATLVLGSALQMFALSLYLGFTGLASLYVISALFGLFQGGIIPAYAMIVRECFPPREAGMRLGIVLMATLLGMALGGWMSGAIFDLTGSYRAAFINGLAWNALNLLIAGGLLYRQRRRRFALA